MPIFDQGYQHWQGQLAGHGWRWLAVARHGVRAGMKSMLLRVLIIIAWVPALVLAGFICLWGLVEQKTPWAIGLLGGLGLRELVANPTLFRMTMWTLSFHIFIVYEMFFIMILVLMVGPGLISQDLRFNALPLYFSRPVLRIDYFLGKLGVIGFFLGLVTVVPAVAAWCLGVLFSLDFSVIFDTFRILLAMIVYGLVVTVSAGLLMLALSSLTRNSRYVGAIWAGFVMLTLIIYLILEKPHFDNAQEHENEMRMRAVRNNIPPRGNPNAQQPHELKVLREAERKSKQEIEEDFRHDWRPCVSYMSNLLRIGDTLLGTYDAEDKFHELLMRMQQHRPPNDFGGPPLDDEPEVEPIRYDPRWPSYWSGLILIALGGLSVWILNMRVKNLDRLR